MAIHVLCSGCGTQYRTDESFAGRKVKCRNCGTEFTIRPPRAPAASASPDLIDDDQVVEESDPLDELAAMERTAAPAEPQARPLWGRARPPVARPSAARAPAVSDFDTAPAPAAPKARRPHMRNEALADFIDQWLPWGLVVVFYGPLLVLGFMAAFKGPIPPVSLLMQAVAVALLVFVTLPIAAAGLRIGLGMRRITIREDARFKILAAYCPTPAAMVLGILMTIGAGMAFDLARQGSAGASELASRLVVGMLLGIAVSFFLIWLLFHLRFVEALIAWVFTTIFYFLGTVLAAFILALVVVPVGWLMSSRGYHLIPGSAQQQVASGKGQSNQQRQDAGPNRAQPNAPANQPSRADAALRSKAEENLRQIGQAAIQAASSDPHKMLPPTLQSVAERGALLPGTLASPFQPGGGGYYYASPIAADMPPNTLVAYDMAELTAQGGTHVLLLSGDVRWVAAADLQQVMTASDQALRQWRDERLRLASSTGANAMARGSSPGTTDGGNSDNANQSPSVPKPQAAAPDQFQTPKTGIVVEARSLDFADGATRIIPTLTPSPYFAAVKSETGNQDVIEVWDVLTNQKKGDATIPHESGGAATYALSPNGAYLAHIARWPKMSVRIWSFKSGSESRVIPLNDKLGEPSLEGFLSADVLAVLWMRGFDQGFETWDVSGGRRLRQIPFEHFNRSTNNGVVSADGRQFALTTTHTRNSQPQLQFYNLLGSGGYRWKAITDVDGSVAGMPAGMAFSPDGKKIAALFEHTGQGLILVWNAGDGRTIGQYEVALPARPGGAEQRRLDWILNGSALVVYGASIIDAGSGRLIDQIEGPFVTGQWVAAPDTIVLSSEGRGAKLVTLKLDPAKAGLPTTAPVVR